MENTTEKKPERNNRGNKRRGQGARGNGKDNRDNRDNRKKQNRKFDKAPKEKEEFQDRLVAINRVAKTVKGGRNIRFNALIVIGDQKGRVGCGMAKAAEVPEAIRKAKEDAKKHLIKVPLIGTTIPHEIIGEFGAGRVLLKPAKEGSGVIAGGAVRAVCELAGIEDVKTKCLGSSNPRNIVNAAMEALKGLKRVEDVARLRGKTVEEILK